MMSFANLNWDRTGWTALALLLCGGLMWTAAVRAESQSVARPAVKIPGADAYRAALAAAEQAYVKQVMDARRQQVQAIRDLQSRARMTPEMWQALEAEVKRIESLGRPRVDPEPAATPAATVRQVSISMDTPSPLWSLSFAKAKRVGDELWVLWQLHEKDGMGAAVITKRSASAALNTGDLPADAPVRHFVMGKTFNWSDPNVDAKYVAGEAELGEGWRDGRPLKPASEK